mmetsp:Transcript_91980/g.177220  ORF Transcript_91980/g.177220 Transcript_91980/m.177220 type:complete len:510 (-) Transcript_91980:60-1589(-)
MAVGTHREFPVVQAKSASGWKPITLPVPVGLANGVKPQARPLPTPLHRAVTPVVSQPAFALSPPPRRPGLPGLPGLPLPTPVTFRPPKAKAFVQEAAKAAPPSSTKAPAFAVLNSERGPVLAPSEAVPGMLKADWTLFLELSAYALSSLPACNVAFGIEEVAEAVAQVAVAVLFVPVGCGHGGEGAVRRVAAAGGRGYIVGLGHELHEDVAAWGAAAILRQPLRKRLDISVAGQVAAVSASMEETEADGSPSKRQRQLENDLGERREAISVAVPKSKVFFKPPSGEGNGQGDFNKEGENSSDNAWWDEPAWDGVEEPEPEAAMAVATAKASMAMKQEASMAIKHEAMNEGESTGAGQEETPQAQGKPVDDERELRRAIKALGKLEALRNKESIPNLADAMVDKYLGVLGPGVVYGVLTQAFLSAHGVAHRKAMVYVTHELFMRKRGRLMKVDDRRAACFRGFFLQVGKRIRGFRADERQAYVRLVHSWETNRVFVDEELKELKKAWDID